MFKMSITLYIKCYKLEREWNEQTCAIQWTGLSICLYCPKPERLPASQEAEGTAALPSPTHSPAAVSPLPPPTQLSGVFGWPDQVCMAGAPFPPPLSTSHPSLLTPETRGFSTELPRQAFCYAGIRGVKVAPSAMASPSPTPEIPTSKLWGKLSLQGTPFLPDLSSWCSEKLGQAVPCFSFWLPLSGGSGEGIGVSSCNFKTMFIPLHICFTETTSLLACWVICKL